MLQAQFCQFTPADLGIMNAQNGTFIEKRLMVQNLAQRTGFTEEMVKHTFAYWQKKMVQGQSQQAQAQAQAQLHAPGGGATEEREEEQAMEMEKEKDIVEEESQEQQEEAVQAHASAQTMDDSAQVICGAMPAILCR